MTEPAFAIREECSGDLADVCAVNVAAFAGNAEADLVAGLWRDGDALFGLVAETPAEIVGHVLFSRLRIHAAVGAVEVAALAPLAVIPSWQRRGVGTALVLRGLALCRERAVPAVVVLGDPCFYGRFGFRAETASLLRAPWSGPHLMALELESSSLDNTPAVASYPAAFRAVG